MKLIKTDPQGTCSWCGKPKDVVHVAFEDGSGAVLCWPDLRRMAGLRLPQPAGDEAHAPSGRDT
jgi:hypothetical protein